MFFCDCLICDVVILFVVYKILDRLIRIPRIGNYSDRYIFVTGCDTGFGNLLAKRLDGLGCNVFAGCLTEKGETELKKVSSQRLITVSMDVANQDSVRKAFAYVKSKLPLGRGLWGVLNNAGVYHNNGYPEWFTLDDYKRQCDVNLWGLIDVTLTFLPLVKAEKGRVVNTSSIAGLYSYVYSSAYGISKYGVEAFTDALRLRCQTGQSTSSQHKESSRARARMKSYPSRNLDAAWSVSTIPRWEGILALTKEGQISSRT